MEMKDKMKGGLLLNVIVRQSVTFFLLFVREDKALLVWRGWTVNFESDYIPFAQVGRWARCRCW